MQQLSNKTFAVQTNLGLYCRTGMNEPPTSIQENTFQYRRLVYNVVLDTLETAFPITIHLIGKRRWEQLVKQFFEKHKCQSAQVWKLPFEFYGFYNEQPLPFKKEFPLLKELLLFEWLEIEVFMMEDEAFLPFTTLGDIETDILIPNPEIKIQPLQYPLHKKKTKNITENDKGNYYVSIHRDYESKQVQFNDISLPMVEILIKLNEKPCAINQLTPILNKYIKDKLQAYETTKNIISFGLNNGLILGFKTQYM